MLDIKWIRENPEECDRRLQRRGLEPLTARILALDEAKRSEQTRYQAMLAERNDIAKMMGSIADKQGEAFIAAKEKASELKEAIAKLEATFEQDDQLEQFLLELPNLPDDDVPEGITEDDNVELSKFGAPTKLDFEPKHHFELGEALGMMDFERTSKISGARFTTLQKDLSKLERALKNFMLDMHTTEFGYTEMSPPFLVRSDAMLGSGQLPKFAEDAFRTTNDYWLIPTSEVSLVNFVRDSIIPQEELPLRFTAYSPCFRSEAGSAGKDTRGMIRQHQFSKIELVSITTPEASAIEHERMTSIAEEVLKRLELPYRVIIKCIGDTGFTALKTFDLEVWLPGQQAYREISSCSNCGDFQARRMKTRLRPTHEKHTQFVHTLNGSALAIGRTIVAIMENYQQSDGKIALPKVLYPYMNHQTIIG